MVINLGMVQIHQAPEQSNPVGLISLAETLNNIEFLLAIGRILFFLCVCEFYLKWCHFLSPLFTDTSFLEFCLKQSRSEAEILLVENIGSFDPNHSFIDKFLNYKDFLPSDILEIAFQSRKDQKATGLGPRDMNPVEDDYEQGNVSAQDGSTAKGGGGKKKGKKGKKVSPSVLGFNVVSNRIMMGEIQTPED